MLLVTYNTGNLLCTCIPHYDIFICKFTRTYKGLKEYFKNQLIRKLIMPC